MYAKVQLGRKSCTYFGNVKYVRFLSEKVFVRKGVELQRKDVERMEYDQLIRFILIFLSLIRRFAYVVVVQSITVEVSSKV